MDMTEAEWVDGLTSGLIGGLHEVADPERAPAMRAYMKDIGPFLGVSATDRRRVERAVWKSLGPPTRETLLAGATAVWRLPEREYQYAAGETLGRFVRLLEAADLADAVQPLLTDRPWWDTVDLLGSHVITPMVAAQPDLVTLMWQWNGTDDEWLIRASIQHQRGRRGDTDLDLLFALCAPHTGDRRFFVAKAIGWALRDAAALDAVAVSGFLEDHPELPAVARREARRGVDRAG